MHSKIYELSLQARQRIARPKLYGNLLKKLRSRTDWNLDSVEIIDGRLIARGWIVGSVGEKSNRLFINGQSFTSESYDISRPDLRQVFWYEPDAAKSGFCCIHDEPNQLSFPLRFEVCSNGSPILGMYPEYLLPDDDLPTPDSLKRKRVHGGTDELSFKVIGASTFVKLQRVLKEYFNSEFSNFPRILDWGCGCGRLSRHFSKTSVDFFGVDIDKDNIQWCQNNFPFGTFEVISDRPPTHLPPNSFNLVIGISIFTHLKEFDQNIWLEELRRITAPCGVLLLTVLGKTAAFRAKLPWWNFIRWQQNGIFCIGDNFDLRGAVDIPNYYKDVLHTRDYLSRKWSKYFDIVTVLEGYIGNHQDLVILKRRPN